MAQRRGYGLPAMAKRASEIRAWNRPVWWILLAGAICTDVLAQGLGSVVLGPGGYMLLWLAAFLAQPRTLHDAVTMAYLPWIFPVFAFSSFLWSDAPVMSFKIGLEILFTVAATMLMVRRVPPRDLILVLLLVTLIGGVASLIVGTRSDALIGIYGSKNSLSFFAALLLIAAVATLLDRRQHWIMRGLAILGSLLAPILLIEGKSAGAFIGAAAALATMLACLSIGIVPRHLRGIYVSCFGIIGLIGSLILLAVLEGDMGRFLELIGKNSTLTGRTYLWQRAAELIEQRPLLGHGLYSFWIQGSVEAEGLWRYAKIDARMGFHFHNLYYETAIDLGYIGWAALLLQIIASGVAVLSWAIRRPGIESAFFFSFLSFLYSRMFSEVEIGGPFVIQCMFFNASWVYATKYEVLNSIWNKRKTFTSPFVKFVTNETTEINAKSVVY